MLLIAAPLPIASATGNGAGTARLLTPDPREAWIGPAATTARVTLDLGAARTFDTVFLGAVSITGPASLSVSVDGGATVQAAASVSRVPGRAGHALLALPAPVTGRQLQLTLATLDQDRPVSVGVALVGLSVRPAWPQEWGGGRAVIDTGTRTRLSAGFGIDPGQRKASWSWTLGDLSDDELERLFALVLDRGDTRPVLVVESLAAPVTAERIHYGCFDKLEAYERRAPGVTRWALSIEDWM